MKRFFVPIFCLISLMLITSCASSTANNIKNREIAEAVYQEGKAYFAQKRYSIALGKFIEAEKVIEDDRFLQYDLGYTYYIKKKHKLAEIHFKKALVLEPDFMVAMNALGVVYLEQKKWDRAIECFNKCLDSLFYPTPHFAYANLGWVYLDKKHYILAKNFFQKALKIAPNYSRALHGFATVSIETNKDLNIVISKLQRALHKFPKAMIIHYDLARLYEKVRQYSKARYYWEKVINLAPEGSKFQIEAESRL